MIDVGEKALRQRHCTPSKPGESSWRSPLGVRRRGYERRARGEGKAREERGRQEERGRGGRLRKRVSKRAAPRRGRWQPTCCAIKLKKQCRVINLIKKITCRVIDQLNEKIKVPRDRIRNKKTLPRDDPNGGTI
jgi:hypothetical protein